MMYRLLAVCLLIFSSFPVFSQLPVVDSSSIPASDYAKATFVQAMQVQKEIYAGLEHLAYQPGIEGFAYFISSDGLPGSVSYNGIEYPNEVLMYDQYKDKLVLKRPDGFSIELRSEKIDWFRLPGHLFVRVNENSAGLKPGFYHQLVSGPITVLAKREKLYNENIEGTQVQKKFTSQTFYYAIRNNQSHSIRNLGSLLDLTGDRGNEIQKQLKKEGIKYKKNREAALTAAAGYYNKMQF